MYFKAMGCTGTTVVRQVENALLDITGNMELVKVAQRCTTAVAGMNGAKSRCCGMFLLVFASDTVPGHILQCMSKKV